MHDHESIWIAKWIDQLTGREKYVWPHESSEIQQSRSKDKYDKALRIEGQLGKLRRKTLEAMASRDEKKRKTATVSYLIDKLGMRVGDEKDEDEADTVGATTLRVEHVKIEDAKIEFDFLGKDSVRWVKTLSDPEPILVQNLRRFTAKKKPGDEIFDVVTSSMVNRFLSEIIPGLTAKVFRTYHATLETKRSLSSRDVRDADDLEKRYFAKEANLSAAIFCNHKRTPPKTWEQTLKKKEEKLAEYRAKGKEGMARKMSLDVEFTKKTKDYNLNTSLKNYIDPRVYKSWCDYAGLDWNKLYTTSLQRKFSWVAKSKKAWTPQEENAVVVKQPALAPHEGPDVSQLVCVRPPLVLGGLHQDGELGDLIAVKERPEPLLPYPPHPDVLVPVEVGPEDALRVVQVDDLEPPQPHARVEERQRLVDPPRCGYVEPCSEGVARVEADPDPVPLVYPVEDHAELLEPSPDAVLLTGRVLDEDRCRVRVRVERLVARLYHVPHADHRALPHVGPYVRHHIVDVQLAAPAHLGGQRGPALLDDGPHRGREVGKIWHVDHHPLEAGPGPLIGERPGLLVTERLELPAAGVPGEQLEGRAVRLQCPVDRHVDRTGYGYMETYERFSHGQNRKDVGLRLVASPTTVLRPSLTCGSDCLCLTRRLGTRLGRCAPLPLRLWRARRDGRGSLHSLSDRDRCRRGWADHLGHDRRDLGGPHCGYFCHHWDDLGDCRK